MDRQTQSIALEKQHVHDVYERIAPHFSDTRYKAWPRVKEFLLGLEPGSIVADVGCGHGKYLGINKQIFKIGSDCCPTLVNIAHRTDHEAMVCDNIRLPYRDNSFDAVISIAVIHHFATTERRAQALNELARICRPGGQVMIYVWAMEQKLRKFDAQDVLVPWHLQPRHLKNREQSRKFLSHRFVSSNSPIKDDPSKKQSQQSNISAASAANKSTLHSSHGRVPFIPREHSTELTNGFKPAARHVSKLLRTHSDQGYDPLVYAEKTHFKRLLLPTRSSSADEVFVNISTKEDRITCREVCVGDTWSLSSRRLGCEGSGGKKKGVQRMFSFDEKQPRESVEETSLIESLASTATQLLRAISRQNSLEIKQQPPTCKEFKGKGVEMSMFSKNVVLQRPEKSVLCGQRDADVYSNCNGDQGVENCYSQGNTRSSNCAIETFSKSSVNGLSVSAQHDTPTLPNGYPTDTEDQPNSIHQIQPSDCEVKTYNSRASIQLTPLPNVQPIVETNCVTAQGELYHKSRPLRTLPHRSVSRERDSSVDSVSSSDDSLTAFPVEVKNSDRSFHSQATDKTNEKPTCTLPDSPSMRHFEQTQLEICNTSKHEANVSAANGESQSTASLSEAELSSNSVASNSANPAQELKQCNGSAVIVPVASSTVPPQHQQGKMQESHPADMNCECAVVDKQPSNGLMVSSECQDPTTSSANNSKCTTPQTDPPPDNKHASKNPKTCPAPAGKDDPSLYLRYYHVFREGELVDLIEERVDSLHILRSYYDHANWCVIAEKVQVWTI